MTYVKISHPVYKCVPRTYAEADTWYKKISWTLFGNENDGSINDKTLLTTKGWLFARVHERLQKINGSLARVFAYQVEELDSLPSIFVEGQLHFKAREVLKMYSEYVTWGDVFKWWTRNPVANLFKYTFRWRGKQYAQFVMIYDSVNGFNFFRKFALGPWPGADEAKRQFVVALWPPDIQYRGGWVEWYIGWFLAETYKFGMALRVRKSTIA